MDSCGLTPEQLAGQSYATTFAEAVRVLTEAARLTWSRIDTGGQTMTFPCDWADFVTQALAGAAANLGGIEAALAARPGSWEADGVRRLLISAVGQDEAVLLEHRTNPVKITLYIDEIMVHLGVWRTYDEAEREINRRSFALGSCQTMRATDAAPLAEFTPEQEAQAIALDETAARLEEQRLRDWIEYAHLLKANVEAAATRREGLRVPVYVSIDLDSCRPSDSRRPTWGLAEELVEEAIQATQLPGSGRPPLERIGAGEPS